MSLPFGFTKKKLEIWGMRRDGHSLAEIGRTLGVTRQAIHKIIPNIDDLIANSLRYVAKAAKIDVRYLNTKKGILLGYSHETESRVIITFSTQHGAQIWHHHEGKCNECTSKANCKKVLLEEAEERGISLTDEELKLQPSELARKIFSKVIPGLEP